MGLNIGKILKKAAKAALSPVTYGLELVGDALLPDVNIPQPEKPPVMPIPDEEAQSRELRRRRARTRGRGRKASILSEDESTLG
jgi:hypothetical protein